MRVGLLGEQATQLSIADERRSQDFRSQLSLGLLGGPCQEFKQGRWILSQFQFDDGFLGDSLLLGKPEHFHVGPPCVDEEIAFNILYLPIPGVPRAPGYPQVVLCRLGWSSRIG
jgi:hypothetical protein